MSFRTVSLWVLATVCYGLIFASFGWLVCLSVAVFVAGAFGVGYQTALWDRDDEIAESRRVPHQRP